MSGARRMSADRKTLRVEREVSHTARYQATTGRLVPFIY
jgi:hypothetical protein